MPSGALCAGSPTSTGASAAQSSAHPPGLVTALATSGTSASDPAGLLSSWSGSNGQPRSRPAVTGTTSSGGWLLTYAWMTWPKASLYVA